MSRLDCSVLSVAVPTSSSTVPPLDFCGGVEGTQLDDRCVVLELGATLQGIGATAKVGDCTWRDVTGEGRCDGPPKAAPWGRLPNITLRPEEVSGVGDVVEPPAIGALMKEEKLMANG